MTNEPIVLESYVKIHAMQSMCSMCGVMHELCNKTDSYDEYIENIKYYLVVGGNIGVLERLPEFIWDTCKETLWEDVYMSLNDESKIYKGWIRNQKIKKVLE